MSRVPSQVRKEVRQLLWTQADEQQWVHLSAAEKSRWYGVWAESPDIGQRLGPFMDPLKIRVYLKDTLLKDYHRSRLKTSRVPLLHLGLNEELEASVTFEKPYGLVTESGGVVAWGRASEWKTVLMAVHERAHRRDLVPYGVVLLDGGSRFQGEADRVVVEDAARLLKIPKLVWID